MKSQIWAIEQLIKDMLLIDAYILLKSLELHEDKFSVIGLEGKYTFRQFMEANNLAMARLDETGWRVCFKGGPIGDYYVTSVKSYVVDRVLQAILTYGPAKVSKVFDEIKCLTT